MCIYYPLFGGGLQVIFARKGSGVPGFAPEGLRRASKGSGVGGQGYQIGKLGDKGTD